MSYKKLTFRRQFHKLDKNIYIVFINTGELNYKHIHLEHMQFRKKWENSQNSQ